MSKFDDFNVWNNTAFSVAQDILSTYHSSKLFESINTIRDSIASFQLPYLEEIKQASIAHNLMKEIMPAIRMTSAFHDYIQNMQGFQAMIPDSLIEAIQVRESIASALGNIDLSFVNQFSEIISGFSINDNLPWIETIRSFEDIDLSDDPDAEAEVAQEIKTLIANPSEILNSTSGWTVVKKYALKILVGILLLLLTPAIDETKATVLEALGINQMWEDSGYYEFIHGIFGVEDSIAMSEEEAKATVDKSQTGNISKQNREDLLGKIKEIRTYIASAPQDENTGNLLRYLSEIEKDVNGHKYGLVFEEHREDIDVVLDTYTPVLTEQEELFIDNGGQMNFLVEGDNLASLKLLEKTHKGKIDVIYIDPPYNTKNKDFIYDDIFIDNVDGFRHSKWVSFIQPRLKLAKSLLTQGGVIFISIDDNEQAALKMLCDNIFGEHNFVSQLVWEKKKKGSFLSDSITNIKEYILVYTNNKLAFKGLIGEVNDNTETYPCINAVNKREVRKIPKGIKSNYKEKNHFLPAGTIISDTTMNIIFLTDLIIKDNVLAEDVEIEGNWRYSQDAMWEYGLKGEIYITRDLYLRRIVSQARHKMMKDLLPRVGNDTELTYNSLIDINDLFASGWGSNEDADEELRLILGKQKLFDYPKPTRLLTKLLLATRKPNAVCLDFFAGSGTFGHAVMSSNLLDNGIRKFILCTNNENNICRDVTYERIKRVIDKENYEASLKYFKVEYVPIDEQLYYEYADELLCHVKELVELENGINFTENAEIGIVLTDEEIFDFFDNIDEYSNCKKLYIGHDLLLDEEQEAIVSKNGIQVIIIPDYYYRDLQDS